MTSFAMPTPNPVMRVLLGATGSLPGRLELRGDTLEVRLGFTWRGSIPRASITSAGRDSLRTLSIGAHGWGGRWLVNTTTSDLVVLTIDPEVRAYCLGWPIKLRELHVSVADADAFLMALGAPPAR